MVLPAVQETGVQSLGWEDPMEEGMATHCSISWETPWARSLSGYSSWGCKESDVTVWLTQTCTWACVHSHTCTHTHTHTQSLIRKPIPETIIWPTSQGDWFVNVKSSWDVYLQVYYFLIFWSSLVFKKFCPFHHVRCIIPKKSIFRPLDLGQAIAFIVPNSALFICLWTLKKKSFHTSRIFF